MSCSVIKECLSLSFLAGVPTVITVTQFWASHQAVSAARAPVQMDPTVGATLPHLVTRITGIDKLSATVTKDTQVNLIPRGGNVLN